VKIRIQFTPALTAALICAAGWHAFWLLAFQPAPLRPLIARPRPKATRLVMDNETLRTLRVPTLFALPSNEGFSGNFLGDRVDIHLSLEKPASPIRYLPQENAIVPSANLNLLTTETLIPKNELPVPGTLLRQSPPPGATTQLFLSPELKPRAHDALRLNIVAAGLPETIRVNLTISPDGIVERALFENPAASTALLNAVRQLHFKPAAGPTEGWMDIHFTREGKE
jgi:hypothetical protein